jgi:HEAT repeat protein
VRRGIAPVGVQNLLDAIERITPDRLRGVALVLGWLEGPAVERAMTRLLGQPTLRAKVVESLVRYGERVVALLVDQLRAQDLDTRQAAVIALGRIGDTKATAPLVDVLLGDPALTIVAAGALARIGDGAAFPALLGLIGHRDSAVRQAVIGALNSIGHPDMPGAIVGLLDDPDPQVRESAVKIAGYFGYAGCVDALLARCRDEDEQVRRAAVEHLPFVDDPRVVATLAQALTTDAPTVRAAVARALSRIELADAVPLLLSALEDVDAWVRYFATTSLGQHGAGDALPAVIERLHEDSAGQVRLAAAGAIGRIGGPRAVQLLAPLINVDNLDLARAAIRALGAIGDPSAWPPLREALRADDHARRLEAVHAVASRAGADAADALQWAAAVDGHIEVSRAAIEALAHLAAGSTDERLPAVRALVALTSDATRREFAIAALSGLPPALIDQVAAGLSSPSWDVRCAVVQALARMKQPAASQWLKTALDDRSAAVRAAAVKELRHLGTRGVDRKLLDLARTDPDDSVRQAAFTAVSHQSTAAQMPDDRTEAQ